VSVINDISIKLDSLSIVSAPGSKPRKPRTPTDEVERKVKDPLSRAMIDWALAEAQRRGWGDTELAKRAKVTQSAVSEMKAGTRKVSYENWVKLLRAFGLELRAGLHELADWLDEQATVPDGDEYEDDGKYARKKSLGKAVSATEQQESTRPPR
jgi:ribosome-binding protein aMBF1 (putative translation factor)